VVAKGHLSVTKAALFWVKWDKEGQCYKAFIKVNGVDFFNPKLSSSHFYDIKITSLYKTIMVHADYFLE